VKPVRKQHSERGLAMVTSLMVLSFLTVIGAAMLASTNVDVRITDNYRTNTQLLFLAEAGFEAAREQLRVDVEAKIKASSADSIETLEDGITAVFQDYDGADGVFSTSIDPAALAASDDVAYRTGTIAASGDTIGTYTAYIRNDPVDGGASNTDSNKVITILSIGTIGNFTKIVEIDVKKGEFPDVPSAVTLNGDVPPSGFQTPTSNNFDVFGDDAAGIEPAVNAVGVIGLGTSGVNVEDAISAGADYSDSYCGENEPPVAGSCAGGPDIDDVSGELGGQLLTAAGLLTLIDSMESAATHTTCPNTSAWGSSASPRVTVVRGDCNVPNNVDGWGLLVVNGALDMGGNGSWNGLIIVVDDTVCNPNGAGGTPHYAASVAGTAQINGGIFVASVIAGQLDDACLNFNGGGGSNGGVQYNSETVRNAFAGLPFFPVAWREY